MSIPTKPLFKKVMASVPPLFPTKKCISAPVAPTPDVVCKLKSEVVPIPPITSGTVKLVVKVGASLKTESRVPVSSLRAASKPAELSSSASCATSAEILFLQEVPLQQ